MWLVQNDLEESLKCGKYMMKETHTMHRNALWGQTVEELDSSNYELLRKVERLNKRGTTTKETSRANSDMEIKNSEEI